MALTFTTGSPFSVPKDLRHGHEKTLPPVQLQFHGNFTFRCDFSAANIAVATFDSVSNAMRGRTARRMLMREGVENPAGARL
jgi:hypothetical protein